MLKPEMLVVELGFALLIAGVLANRLTHVRLLIAAAAFVWLGHAMWVRDYVTAGWTAALAALALILVGKRLWEDTNVRFTLDEKKMIEGLFDGLSTSRARHFLDQGVWLNGKEGDMLTKEGEPVAQLYYLAEGEARVIVTGRQVGLCRAGDLIGELTVLSGETASATVILNGPARFWCAPAEDLRPYVEAHDDIRRAIEHGFATVLKAKLRASNRTIAEAASGRG